MTELDFVAKYGPVGLLGLMFITFGRISVRLLDRWFKLADKIEQALDAYMKAQADAALDAEKRHGETRELLELKAKEIRHGVRTDIMEMGVKLGTEFLRVENAVREKK